MQLSGDIRLGYAVHSERLKDLGKHLGGLTPDRFRLGDPITERTDLYEHRPILPVRKHPNLVHSVSEVRNPHVPMTFGLDEPWQTGSSRSCRQQAPAWH